MPETMPETTNHPGLDFTELVTQTLSNALEQIAFICMTPLDPSNPLAMPNDPVRVSLEFRGYPEGRLELCASRSFGLTLCSNAMGDMPEPSEAVARGDDALKELVNITCGTSLRSLIVEGEPSPDMRIPEITPITAEEWAEVGTSPLSTVLDAEGQPIIVRWTFVPRRKAA